MRDKEQLKKKSLRRMSSAMRQKEFDPTKKYQRMILHLF